MTFITQLPSPGSKLPFSRAVTHQGLVYVSGQVALKPGTAEPWCDDVTGQAREVFRLIDGILAEAGTSRERIVMARVYLADAQRDFAAMNAAYSAWLGDHRPARTTVGVELAIAGLLIEVDVIAALPA